MFMGFRVSMKDGQTSLDEAPTIMFGIFFWKGSYCLTWLFILFPQTAPIVDVNRSGCELWDELGS